MTTHQHTPARHRHAHDAHGDGDHESVHDHSSHHHRGHDRGHDQGHAHAHEDMLEVEDAFARIIAHFAPLDGVELPVPECLGMALAEDISSPLNLPPLANSAMDGYAVLHSDIADADAAPPTLSVISAVAAGQVSDDTVTAGCAIRIMTGAPVPDGADTVIPFEETDEVERRRNGQPLTEIVIRKALPLGSNVRPAGEDVGLASGAAGRNGNPPRRGRRVGFIGAGCRPRHPPPGGGGIVHRRRAGHCGRSFGSGGRSTTATAAALPPP